MCGIAGILGTPGQTVGEEEIARMCAALVHRGPDDQGIHVDQEAGIGMRRLSIIDLDGGHQPMSNEDGSVWVVANGEIYNFESLRKGLKARGHVFRSGSDTEVIVHLYEEFGSECVNHLRGMFAIAIWDQRRRQLLLARDRIGIKPLYYTFTGGRLAFASELKALLTLEDVPRRLDWDALGHLFAYLTTPSSSSILRDVHKLEPGHLLLATPGRTPCVRRYWDVTFEPDRGRPAAYFEEGLRALLDDSVRLHLASDVPLGVFLSGGVDSGAVAATMARLSPEPIRTFSIGFEDPRYDESGEAQQLAKAIGSEHETLMLDSSVTDVLDDIAWYLDEPFGDSSAIPTYMVSKLASEHVTVVLSGDGGDELFAGYDKYRVEQRQRRIDAVPGLLRRPFGHVASLMPEGAFGRGFLHNLSLDGDERYLNACTLFKRASTAKLFTADARDQMGCVDPSREQVEWLRTGPDHWLSKLQYFDLHAYLPLDILTKVDRMSMAHSLEVRVPLLDHELIEFAARIPPELQLNGGRSKHLFKEVLRDRLPPTVLDRPKRGFAIPLGDWFRNGLSGYVRDLLLSGTARQRGLFDPGYVEQLLQLHARGRAQDLQLWTLISFELWCRTFLDTAAPTRSRIR